VGVEAHLVWALHRAAKTYLAGEIHAWDIYEGKSKAPEEDRRENKRQI
jgi:hypothetical protein